MKHLNILLFPHNYARTTCRFNHSVSQRDSRTHFCTRTGLLRPCRLCGNGYGGRPFLGSAKARIDVGNGEICFRVGWEDMFFRFKKREEQRFMIQQDSGVLSSHILTHSLTLPLTHSCSGFHWILAQVWFQEISLSHFFAARSSEGTTLG